MNGGGTTCDLATPPLGYTDLEGGRVNWDNVSIADAGERCGDFERLSPSPSTG